MGGNIVGHGRVILTGIPLKAIFHHFGFRLPAFASAYRRDNMGQQHRVRVKRNRRKAYLKRKKVATKSKRRELPKRNRKSKRPNAG